MNHQFRVLVFDETPLIGALLRDTLEPDGHVVLHTADAPSALDRLQEMPFDLLLLDASAASETQAELARAARARRADAAVFLLCSGDLERAEKLKLRLGAEQVVHKPLDPQIVREVVAARRRATADLIPPSPRIVVVDDDLMVLESVIDVLQERYEVRSTRSPLDALRLLGEGPHEILLTDLLMYEMDGTELIHWARTIRPTLLAIVMTGYGTKESAIAAVRKGAYDFLEKPLTPALLLQTVERSWRSLRSELENRQLVTELERTNQQLRLEMDERRRVETELLQSQKLEAVGQLAAGIAHEINTPLQFIGDNTRFVRDSLDQLLSLLDELLGPHLATGDEDAQRLTSRVKEVGLSFLRTEIPAALKENLEGVKRLDGIVQAMREFAHPGGAEMTDMDLNRALNTMATVSRSEWKYVADMVLDLEADLPPVPALPGEINQAILNLIINAAHAIREVVSDKGEHGTITIRTRRAGEAVVLEIADTGCGIPEPIQERVFEPFFTTKAVGQGTGQGLAIAHSVVVRKHGGQLTFTSQEGQGTTFRIVLPLRPGLNVEGKG
jgi:signal transduction histidine kinase